MKSVTELAQAMVATIAAALPDIDAIDLNSYLPAVESQKAALVGVPTGATSALRPFTMNGEWEAVHTVRLQLWVKLDSGALDEGVERARDIGHQALRALAAGDGDGYELTAEGTPLAAAVGTDILSVAEVPYLVVTLTAEVWETGAPA